MLRNRDKGARLAARRVAELVGDRDSGVSVFDRLAAVVAPRRDDAAYPRSDGDLPGGAAVSDADAGAILVACRLDVAAVDGDRAASGKAAAADSGGVFAADGPHGPAVDGDAAAVSLEAAPYARRVAGAGRGDGPAVDHDVAAGEVPGAADSGRSPIVSGRVERAATLDGQRLPDGDVDARVVVVVSRDDVVALKDDRRVAEARDARPLGRGVAADGKPVHRRAGERHRRAVRDGYLALAADGAGEDVSVLEHRLALARDIVGLYDRPLRDVACLPFGLVLQSARHGRGDRCAAVAVSDRPRTSLAAGRGNVRDSRADEDVSAVGVVAAADAGGPFPARGGYVSALDLYLAAVDLEAAADARAASAAGRCQRAVAFDDQTLAYRNVDAGIVLVPSRDDILALEDNRRVAFAGDARPLVVGVVYAVDRRVRDRHRRAVGDRKLPFADGRVEQDLSVADDNVPIYVAKVAVPFNGARLSNRLVGKTGADYKSGASTALVYWGIAPVFPARRDNMRSFSRPNDDVAGFITMPAAADGGGMSAARRLHVAASDDDAGTVASAANTDAGAAGQFTVAVPIGRNIASADDNSSRPAAYTGADAGTRMCRSVHAATGGNSAARNFNVTACGAPSRANAGPAVRMGGRATIGDDSACANGNVTASRELSTADSGRPTAAFGSNGTTFDKDLHCSIVCAFTAADSCAIRPPGRIDGTSGDDNSAAGPILAISAANASARCASIGGHGSTVYRDVAKRDITVGRICPAVAAADAG